jgi:hypothetical protein
MHTHARALMGRYHFYHESLNEYSFMDEDLGLTTDKSNFDHYDFYNNLEELQEPPKTDNDTISNMQSPTLQKWSYFLQDTEAFSSFASECSHNVGDMLSNKNGFDTLVQQQLMLSRDFGKLNSHIVCVSGPLFPEDN